MDRDLLAFDVRIFSTRKICRGNEEAVKTNMWFSGADGASTTVTMTVRPLESCVVNLEVYIFSKRRS